MIPILIEDNVALYHGDAECIGEVCQPESVDAIVTDPPAGIGFMGKQWDGNRGGRDNWIACMTITLVDSFAALKPGGHALVWALPRTSHWTATALENIGFEIRDVVMHVFGSGFPKSLDVSKAIDAEAGAEREVVGQGVSGTNAGMQDLGPSGIKGGDFAITAPTTPEAKQWDGWGTALKPSMEAWILCRKPLVGTVAANVLKHGTGAINVDGCRVSGDMGPDRALGKPRRTDNTKYGKANETINPQNPAGRWPAHLTHDGSDEVMALFPQTTSTKSAARTGRSGEGWGLTATGAEYDDVGSAARFFYCAKPSRSERDNGCHELEAKGGGARNIHPTVKPVELMRWLCRLITPPGGLVLDPFTGSGTTAIAALAEGFRFIGCEQSAEYAEIAKHRIKGRDPVQMELIA